MPYIVVLADGETYTGLEGSEIWLLSVEEMGHIQDGTVSLQQVRNLIPRERRIDLQSLEMFKSENEPPLPEGDPGWASAPEEDTYDALLTELKDLTSYSGDEDLISIPHSVVESPSYGVVKIYSDDGNESSYGSEEWHRDGDEMVLIRDFGRDTFDGNFIDRVLEEKSEGNYERWCELYDQYATGESGSLAGYRMPLTEFVEGVKKHIASWKERTDEYLERNKEG